MSRPGEKRTVLDESAFDHVDVGELVVLLTRGKDREDVKGVTMPDPRTPTPGDDST